MADDEARWSGPPVGQAHQLTSGAKPVEKSVSEPDEKAMQRDTTTRQLEAAAAKPLNAAELKLAHYGACRPTEANGCANGRTQARLDKAAAEAAKPDTKGAKGDPAGARESERPTLVERLARLIPGLGIILALCASLFLGTAGVLVKLTTSVHGIQVAVCRATIQVLVYGTIVCVRRLGVSPARQELVPVGMRALLGAASITLSYHALKIIPLGDATTIRFSLPIWTLIMSYFFLNESCSAAKMCAAAISLGGVVLIAKPDECVYLFHLLLNALRVESDEALESHQQDYQLARYQALAPLLAEEDALLVSGPPGEARNQTAATLAAASSLRQFEGCMMALGSSIFLALSVVALRLCRKTPAEITILWLSLVSVALGTASLLLLHEWRLPDNLADCLYILLNGLCGSLGQWCMTSALKVEQSGVVSLARTFDIEIAFLYSALLLHEQIRATSILGSICVSTGVVIVVLPKLLSSCRRDEGAATLAPGPP